MRTTEDPSKYQTDLAVRLGAVGNDERIGDVVYACCAVMYGAINQLDPVARAAMKPIIEKFFAELSAVIEIEGGGRA